jgi:hypothetical protein
MKLKKNEIKEEEEGKRRNNSFNSVMRRNK